MTRWFDFLGLQSYIELQEKALYFVDPFMRIRRLHIILSTILLLLSFVESGMPCLDCLTAEQDLHNELPGHNDEEDEEPCSSPLSPCLGCTCTCHTLFVFGESSEGVEIIPLRAFPSLLVLNPPSRPLSPPDHIPLS